MRLLPPQYRLKAPRSCPHRPRYASDGRSPAQSYLRIRRERAVWIRVSFSTSSEAVASSRRMIGAFFRNALAMEIRCRSPPESSQPFSPILVFQPIRQFFGEFVYIGQPVRLPTPLHQWRLYFRSVYFPGSYCQTA